MPAQDHAEEQAQAGITLAHARRDPEDQDPQKRTGRQSADHDSHERLGITVDRRRREKGDQHQTRGRIDELGRNLVQPVVDHDHTDGDEAHDEVRGQCRRPADPPPDEGTQADQEDLGDRLVQLDGRSARPASTSSPRERHHGESVAQGERGGAVVAPKRQAERFDGIKQRRPGHDHRRHRRAHQSGEGACSDSKGARHGRRRYPLAPTRRRQPIKSCLGYCGQNMSAMWSTMQDMNPSPSPLSIEAVGLRKSFGKTVAVDDLAIECVPGQVTALLGPNGAGKSTLVRMVATLTRPDAGTLRVCGVDAIAHPREVRRLIGLAGQSAAVEPALTGRENLIMVAKLFGHRSSVAKSAAESVLHEVGLTDDGGRLVREYSGGMRRRLDLAASLVGAPRVLLLDEPTTGLDPRTRLELWDSVRSLVANGTDVLLTTQYLEEADRLADRVVIIDHGRVIAIGSPSELKSQAGRDVVVVTLARADDLAVAEPILRSAGTDEPRFDPIARALTVAVDSGPDALGHVLAELSLAQVGIDDITLRRPTLDEVFLTLTGAPQ